MSEKKESAKFVAIGKPFGFRVSEGDKGRLDFATDPDKPTTVTNYMAKKTVKTPQADGSMKVEEVSYEVDAVGRARQYVVRGRLQELKDDKPKADAKK